MAYASENFQVERLEVCTRSDLHLFLQKKKKKKQFYIDYSFSSSEKEEDNILTKAGSSTNILNKHSWNLNSVS